MKAHFYLFTLILLLTSCNDTPKEKSTEGTVVQNTTDSAEMNTETSTNSADYSSLYARPRNDCRILEASEIAKVIGIPEKQVTADFDIDGLCRYDITLDDGSTSLYMITVLEIPQHHVQSEVSNYKEGKGGLEHYKSDTGDTDLCIHPYQGWLFLYNTAYDNAVKIGFGSPLALKDMTKEQKTERKTNALRLANYIVEKHQN
jgi:hypothetical protein